MLNVLNSESERATWDSSTCTKFKSSTMLASYSLVERYTELIIKLGPLSERLSRVVPSHLVIAYSCSWKVVLVGFHSICSLVSSRRGWISDSHYSIATSNTGEHEATPTFKTRGIITTENVLGQSQLLHVSLHLVQGSGSEAFHWRSRNLHELS